MFGATEALLLHSDSFLEGWAAAQDAATGRWCERQTARTGQEGALWRLFGASAALRPHPSEQRAGAPYGQYKGLAGIRMQQDPAGSTTLSAWGDPTGCTG